MENISQICISLLPATTMEHLWLLNSFNRKIITTTKKELSGLFQSQGNKCNHIFFFVFSVPRRWWVSNGKKQEGHVDESPLVASCPLIEVLGFRCGYTLMSLYNSDQHPKASLINNHTEFPLSYYAPVGVKYQHVSPWATAHWNHSYTIVNIMHYCYPCAQHCQETVSSFALYCWDKTMTKIKLRKERVYLTYMPRLQFVT